MTPTQAAQQLPLMLDIADLMVLMGCGRTTAYARTQDASFPTPVAFSGKAYRWWRHEVLEWIEAQRLHVRPKRPATARRAPLTGVDVPLPAPVPRLTRRRGGAQ